HGHVHDLANFGGVGLRERSAKNREVLGKSKNQAAFNASIAGDEAIAVGLLLGHAKILRAMRYQAVSLFEGALIEQELDALAGTHLAFFVLPRPPLFAAASLGQRIAPLQLRQLLLQIHAKDYSGELS